MVMDPGEWTVGDLIEELSKHSPLLKVQRDDGEMGPMAVTGVDFVVQFTRSPRVVVR